MYSPKSYQISENNIYTERHQQDEKYDVDIIFYREIFFWFQSADSLDQDAEQSSSIQRRQGNNIEDSQCQRN